MTSLFENLNLNSTNPHSLIFPSPVFIQTVTDNEFWHIVTHFLPHLPIAEEISSASVTIIFCVHLIRSVLSFTIRKVRENKCCVKNGIESSCWSKWVTDFNVISAFYCVRRPSNLQHCPVKGTPSWFSRNIKCSLNSCVNNDLWVSFSWYYFYRMWRE